MADTQGILTHDLLIKVHNMIAPWPKDKQIDWQNKYAGNEQEEGEDFFQLMKPVWRELSESSMNIQLPSPGDVDYLEQLCGLIFILDQHRGFLKGVDQRWTRSFFDPACEKVAMTLHDLEDSPFKKEAWLKRGWTFEHYVARITILWAPLIHSENVMANNWQLNDRIRLYLRDEVEKDSGKQDPYRVKEQEDSEDTQLFSKLLVGGPPSRPTMEEDTFWWLRVMHSHYPITKKFGRYPYVNDQTGRDFRPGEVEWCEENGKNAASFGRLDEETRKAIRKDVEAGCWTPLKLDYD